MFSISLAILLPSLLLLICSHTFGCFSSGDPADEAKKSPISAKLLRTADNQIDNTLSSVDTDINLEYGVDEGFIRTYLKEFGHLSRKSRDHEKKENKTAELTSGIKHFQELMGFKPTGKIDLPTLSRMSWKRCGNADEGSYSSPQIWERSTLFWYLDSPFPCEFSLSQQDMKELIRQAFTAWEIVIAMDFIETNVSSNAQILFAIMDDENGNNAGGNFKNRLGSENIGPSARTGLAIASANNIQHFSKIWIYKHENWSTFQTQEEGKIDIFLVLVHEIGHSLGLKHVGDEQSIMFPMFERPIGEQLPVISNSDVERLRAIYESSKPVSIPGNVPQLLKNSAAPVNNVPQNVMMVPKIVDKSKLTSTPGICPHYILAATNVNTEILYIFNGGNTWLFTKGKIVNGPKSIYEIFPDGPGQVDVAFTSGRLTVLMKGRTLFGFTFDTTQGKFSRAKGFPRELHNRILFTPEAAFPIANGSIILIKDKVFCTYNVEKNIPHMLGNVDEYFPNMPQELRTGFPASPDFALYHMLTPEYAFLYDVRLTRSVGSQSIGRFLGCDDQLNMGDIPSLPVPPMQSIPLSPSSPPRQQLGPPGLITHQGNNELPRTEQTTMIQGHKQGPPASVFAIPKGPPGLFSN